MNISHNLLGASDLLGIANSLMEAVYMAAATLDDQDPTEAIQQVCQAAQQRLSEAGQIIEAVRKGGLS